MVQKGRKPESVLSTLPSTRPARLGRPRAKVSPRTSPKPAAVRPASSQLRAHRAAEAPLGAPHGTELVTTTIRAAGELAQIGLTVSGQVLKRTLGRIPRP